MWLLNIGTMDNVHFLHNEFLEFPKLIFLKKRATYLPVVDEVIVETTITTLIDKLPIGLAVFPSLLSHFIIATE